MEKELRDYQKSVVKDVLESDLDLCITLPTGAGKTVIASALMNKMPGLKIFIVPRLELIKQASDEFGDVDVIWADKTNLTGKDIIIASKDSLRTQIDKIPETRPLTLIFDEAHIGIEQTHKLVKAIKSDRTLGLTATPERMDGLALTKGTGALHKFGVFDDVLVAETVPTLIEKGYLTPLRYYTRPIEGITSVKTENAVAEELSGAQMMSLFNEKKIWGDLVDCYEQYNPDQKPAIGFTVTIEMAEKVCEVFNEAGYDFRVISGEMDVSTRQLLLDRLKTGQIDGLVNAALLTYGFDCPEVYYAFSCRHIKSRPLWFQMIGRILRIHESKEEAVFVDHGDSISEFMEPYSALPIMDPCIKWRYNGITKDEKKALKIKRDQANEVIRMINDLDPEPVDMVEVTTEDLFIRLIKIYNRVSKELGSMKELVSKAKQDTKDAKEKAKRAVKEKAALEEEREELIKENANLKTKAAGPTKFIDKDKTFDYIRKNYCKKRYMYEKRYGKYQAHEFTVRDFKNDEAKLPFYYDKATFERGMSYWKKRIDESGFSWKSKWNY